MATTCGARTRGGGSCQQPPAPGRTRCRFHGGATPRGLALPQTKSGRYSKDLPTRLAADYQAAREDPELISLRDQIALVRARQADILRRVDTGEASAMWEKLATAAQAFHDAAARGDPSGSLVAAQEMARLATKGRGEWRTWRDLFEAIELDRRLTDSERRRLEAIQEMLSADRLMLIVGALVDSVRRHVSDRAQIARIQADIGQLLGGGGGSRVA